MNQSIGGENNPIDVDLTNHPEEPTSSGQNENNLRSDQNLLYTENAAEPTRMSTCGHDSPSSQGQDTMEVTYVAGTEPTRTSQPGITDRHYDTADNCDIPDPAATDVYFVSDTIHAENSAVYTASGENEESGNANGNNDEETQVRQAGSTVTDDGDIEPYAVGNMSDHENYLNKTKHVGQQTDGTTVPAHNLHNPPNETEFENPMYRADVQQASDDSRSDSDAHKPRDPQHVKQLHETVRQCEKKNIRLSCAVDQLIVIQDAFYGRRGKRPSCGCIFRSCNKCQKGYRPHSTVRKRCQGLQRCDLRVVRHNFGDPCPRKKKYLEATYHCEEKKESISFGGQGKGSYQFQNVAGLAVSSTNEIFVADQNNRRIKIFSMKGVFLRSFPIRNMVPQAISTGRNDTLWVALYGGQKNSLYKNAIHQYSKDGHSLAKFSCNRGLRIRGIAWHPLSDKIIVLFLTASMRSGSMWFSPTYTQATPTCNTTRFGSTRGQFWFVAVDKKGDIFIVDTRGSRVLKYDKNGVYVSSFASKGSGAGKLYNPSGICVDSLGRVVVADTLNNRLEMFTAEGEHIRTAAYIHKPKHVAIGGEGQLVVSNQDHFVTILLKYQKHTILLVTKHFQG
ncbi:PREDICTED: uncharacterized protein LOC109463740 [Branchiostoma belcheri]|uniref:Uncharacterized protein LOC109463740 n=1 Tax=Branchiostoma belcheri TaxID=7741 RepID=A0A6P4YBH3_BRABE|nr:PREDICTED: uncharacterized protein LOC109463740 [Branchiostoma belcheri]